MRPSSPVLAVVVALALVAGCGTDRGPGPVSSDDGSAAAATSTAADASPTLDPSMDAGATTIEQAMTLLEDLDSYHVSLSTSPVVGGSPGIPTGSEVTVLRAPQLAFDAVIAAIDEGGVPYTVQTRAIGATAFRMAGDGWYPEYGTAAELLPLYLGPDDLGAFASVIAATRVGDELRNGRPTVHYRTTSSASSLDPRLITIDTGTTFAIDLWVDATDGCLVSAEVRDSGTLASGTAFEHTTRLDVTRIDDASNAVVRPTLWSDTH